MLVRNCIAVAAFATLACGCSSFGKSSELRVAAPAGAKYPDWADTPSQSPEKDDIVTVMSTYNGLMTEKAQLLAAMQADIAEARAERRDQVTVMVNGTPRTMSVEAAAARLEQEKKSIQESAARQVAQPMPKLGGKPPKGQR